MVTVKIYQENKCKEVKE